MRRLPQAIALGTCGASDAGTLFRHVSRALSLQAGKSSGGRPHYAYRFQATQLRRAWVVGQSETIMFGPSFAQPAASALPLTRTSVSGKALAAGVLR